MDDTRHNIAVVSPIPTPYCEYMEELPSAAPERARLSRTSASREPPTPLSIHISHGLAYTIGSALGSSPPSLEICLEAFTTPNKVGLTAGARAWSKHFHRSQPLETGTEDHVWRDASSGWWGTPSGPVASINEKALLLFWKIMDGATWRNLHWLPHKVLVYEVRVPEGYGMRWSQDRNVPEDGVESVEERPWMFRGFVEPMIENGHDVGWRH